MTGLHTMQRPQGQKRPYRRVGRGQSSTRGKQSGRGGKGQTARAGAKIRPEWRDIIKKLPKLRGFGKNRRRGVVTSRLSRQAVALARIEKSFEVGSEVTIQALRDKKLIHAREAASHVKVVGSKPISKKLVFKGISLSKEARAAVEKAGGSIA